MRRILRLTISLLAILESFWQKEKMLHKFPYTTSYFVSVMTNRLKLVITKWRRTKPLTNDQFQKA